MGKQQFSFNEFGASSLLVRSLINEESNVSQFSGAFFSVKNIQEQAGLKEFSAENRNLLVQVLKDQNENIRLSAKSKENIERLKQKNTFTITTGHQLNMATGPLYTLYKILEIINWTEKLNETQTERCFVPIFWMATEDHDFQEINHINLFGSKMLWEHKSENDSVVGRIDVKHSVEFVEQVLGKFKDESLRLKVEQFLEVYSTNVNLGEANRDLINSLFGDYGIVIIDGDNKYLKKEFVSIAKQEIKKSTVYNAVSQTNNDLSINGFHQQVYVRALNLFYIEPNGARVRIEKREDVFLINQQEYSVRSLLDLVEEFPERFSPNALLRPVYQEVVLPNVAYVGGGGEIAYWLQLKSSFSSFGISFPLLKVRDSALIIDERMRGQLSEFGYSVLDLKMDSDELIKDFLKKNQTIELSLSDQKEMLKVIKASVLEKAMQIDNNSTSFIEAEFQRMDNQFDKMEKKFIASEKKNQEKSVKQLQRLQNKLYPNGGLQERHENYLNYLQVPNFIESIKIELKKRMTAKAAIHILNI